MSIFNSIKRVFRKPKPKPNPNPYPKSVAECLDDNYEYRSGVDKVIREFRAALPWQGSPEEMQHKFKVLNHHLAKIHDIEEPCLTFVRRFPTGPCCFPHSRPALIIMELTPDGHYSVVAFLHEFSHTLGCNEVEACKWSLNLFKRYFPKSYAKLEPRGHLLFKKETKVCSVDS